jgi:hypothetical protein
MKPIVTSALPCYAARENVSSRHLKNTKNASTNPSMKGIVSIVSRIPPLVLTLSKDSEKVFHKPAKRK